MGGKGGSEKYPHFKLYSHLLSSDRPANLCKERRWAAEELYIPQDSWSFSPSFLTLFLSIHIFFYTFIALVDTHERIQNPRVKMSIIEIFYGTLKIVKLDLGCLSCLSSHFRSLDF